MDLKEIRQRKDQDLNARLAEIAGEVFKIRCVAERLPPQKGNEIKALRREAAQIRTVLRERSLNVEAKAALAGLDVEIASGKAPRTDRVHARRAKLARQVRETVQPVAE